MRVTAETKEATRQTILDVTSRLLRERRWDEVGTREIASQARIANGTLFNYFPTKEAIVGELVGAALAEASHSPREGTVEEQLFTLIAAGLRRLRPYRSFLSSVIGSILASLEFREEHLSEVERIVGRTLPPMLRHLYWSLYSGVVTFWVDDDSPKQTETLSLLDHTVALFIASLRTKRKESRA